MIRIHPRCLQQCGHCHVCHRPKLAVLLGDTFCSYCSRHRFASRRHSRRPHTLAHHATYTHANRHQGA